MALLLVRLARGFVWLAAAAFGLYRAFQLNSMVIRMQPSAMQETSLIGYVLVDLFIAVIVAKSLDVGFELQERRLTGR